MVLIKYHYTSISIAKVTKVTKPNAVKDVEKLNLLFIAGTSTLENSLAVSLRKKEINKKPPCNPENALLGFSVQFS